MSGRGYETVSDLIYGFLSLLEEGSDVGGLAEETDLKQGEVRKVLTKLERMGLVEDPARPTGFALEAMKLPEAPEK